MNSLMQLSIVAHSLAAGSDGFSDDSECATDDRRKYSDYDSFTWNGPSFPLPYPDHSYAKRPPTPKTLHGHHKELFSPMSINSNQQHISLGTGSRPPTDDPVPSGVESWEGSVTRCICEFQHDDGYMICCDRCSVWQHVDCMGVDRQNIPETYLCELCKPRVVDKHHAIRCQARKRELLMQKQDSSDTDTEEDTKPRKMVIRRKKGKQNLHHGQSTYRRKQQEISKTTTRKQTFRFNPKNKKQSGLRSHSLALSSTSKFSISPTPTPISTLTGNDFVTFRLLQPCRNTYTTELKWKLEEIFSFLDRGVDMSMYATTIDSYHEFSLVSVSMLQISADIKTQGLEASKDLKYEEPIVEYTGKVLLKEQHIYSGSMNHMLQCSIGGSPGIDVCIDSSHHDNHAKFIRRSANPNAQLRHFFDDNNNLRFCIWSTTNILRGSEVTLPLEFENSLNSRPRLTSLNLDHVTQDEVQGHVIHQKRRRRRHSARISESSVVSETVADVELFPPTKEDTREEQQVVDVTSLHTPPLTLQQPKLHSPTKRPSSTVQSHPQEKGRIPKERKRNDSERSNHLSSENSKPAKNLHHVNKTIANNNNNIVEDRSTTKQHKKEDGPSTAASKVEELRKSSSSIEGQDIKKLTREEKKLEAIMKAFERMDKKIERKNQREERKHMAETKTKNHKPKSLVGMGRRKTMSSLNDLGLRADGSKIEIRPNSSVKFEKRKRSSDDDDDDDEEEDDDDEDDDDDDGGGSGGGMARSNFNNVKVKGEGHKTGRNGEIKSPVEFKISNKGENKLKRYSGGDEDEYASDGFKVSNKRCITRGRHGSVGRKKSQVSKKLHRRSSRLLDDQTKKQKIEQAKNKKSLNLKKNISKKNNTLKYVKGIEKKKMMMIKKDRARESLSDDDDDESVANDEASGADNNDDDGDMKFEHVDNDEIDDDDDEGEMKQPLQSTHPFAVLSVFSTGLPASSPVQTVQPSFDPNQGFAKKRWLRQAINESSESHSSTLESGFATPLKKRRLTVDEDATSSLSSIPLLTSLSASSASTSSLSLSNHQKLASNLTTSWLITEESYPGKYGGGKLTLCGDAIKREQAEKISPQPSMKSSPFLSPSSSPVKSTSPQNLSSVVDVTTLMSLVSVPKSVSSTLVSSSPIVHVSRNELKREEINTGTISSILQHDASTSECVTLKTFQHVSATPHQAYPSQPIASVMQHVVSASKLVLPRQRVSTLPASSSTTESSSCSLMPFMGQISEIKLINEDVRKTAVQSSLDVDVLSTAIISSSSSPPPHSNAVSKKICETASANTAACSELSSSSPPLISSSSSRILSPPASSSLLSPVSPLCLSPSSSTVVESHVRDPRYQSSDAAGRNMCNSVGKKKVSLVEYRNRMKSTSSSSSLANPPTSPVYIAPPTCPTTLGGHDIDLPNANQSFRSDVLTRNLDEKPVMADDSGVGSQKAAGKWDFEETAAEKVLTKSLSLTDRLRFEFGLDAPDDDENDVTNVGNVDPMATAPCTTTSQQLPSYSAVNPSSSSPPPHPSLSSSSSSSSSSHLIPKHPRALVTSSSSSPRLFQQHHRHHYHHQHRNRQKQFDSCETPLPSSSSAEANYGVASSSYPSRRGTSREKARHLHRHRHHQDPSPPRSLTSSSKVFQLSRCDGDGEVEEEDPRYSRWGQRSYGSSRSCDSPVRHHHHQHHYQQRQHYYKRRYLPPDDKHGYPQRDRELAEPRERSQFSRIGQRHMKYNSTNNLGFFRTRFQNSK